MVTLSVPSQTDKRCQNGLSFSITYDDAGTDKTSTVKIWFSDTAFRNQFDEYETVVPPITTLDDFFYHIPSKEFN